MTSESHYFALRLAFGDTPDRKWVSNVTRGGGKNPFWFWDFKILLIRGSFITTNQIN